MPVTRDQRNRDVRKRMRRLDDVFHRLIISLERLEIFLEGIRLEGKVNKELSITAVNSTRDLHDDSTNPPSSDSFFGEVQLQCSALFFQTELKDKEEFDSFVKHFLQDLLEWYGGRNESIPYNGVDAFILPIIVSLSQQVKGVDEILEVTSKYVAKIPDMSSFTDEKKADAISNAMEKLIIMMDKHHHQEHENNNEDEDFVFTQHRRGDAVDGYKRLIMAMLSLYDETMPAIVVYRTVSNFLPHISETVPTISESSISEYIESKNSTNYEEMIPQADTNNSSEQEAVEDEKTEIKETDTANTEVKEAVEEEKVKETRGTEAANVESKENDIPFEEIEQKSDELNSDDVSRTQSQTEKREIDGDKQTFFQKITKLFN